MGRGFIWAVRAPKSRVGVIEGNRYDRSPRIVTFAAHFECIMNNCKILIMLVMALSLVSCTDDMPASIANSFAGLLAIWGEVILAILAMLTGIGMIIVGCWLTYAGYTGDYQLFIKGGTLEASLVNATPGVLFIVFGVVVIIYRAKINIKLRK